MSASAVTFPSPSALESVMVSLPLLPLMVENPSCCDSDIVTLAPAASVTVSKLLRVNPVVVRSLPLARTMVSVPPPPLATEVLVMWLASAIVRVSSVSARAEAGVRLRPVVVLKPPAVVVTFTVATVKLMLSRPTRQLTPPVYDTVMVVTPVQSAGLRVAIAPEMEPLLSARVTALPVSGVKT